MDKSLSGKRVKLIRMEDPYTDLNYGDEGTILHTDDIGNIQVKWDKGSSLALIPEIDEYEILEKESHNLIKRFEQWSKLYENSSNFDTMIVKLQELSDLFENTNSYFNFEIYDHIVLLNIGYTNMDLEYSYDYVINTKDLTVEKSFKSLDETIEDQDVVDVLTFQSIDELNNWIDSESREYVTLYESNSYNLIVEKNVPKSPSLWQSCIDWAKSKYDVWPSAYAVGAAAKRYKSKGGKWKKETKKSKKK
jgi:hypothetical protein